MRFLGFQQVIASRNAENSTMIGTGLTMEGINQNYVIYDLMSEQAWRTEPVNLTEWFRDYARRRYGQEDENAQKAWEGLQVSSSATKTLTTIIFF